MKHLLLILVTLVISQMNLSGSPGNSSNLADLPDPLAGTDSKYELSHGNTFPAVFIPFGMSNWTRKQGKEDGRISIRRASFAGSARRTVRPPG